MKIRPRVLIWLIILIPYLRPDCINGTFFSKMWNSMQYISVFTGIFLVLGNIKRVTHLKVVTWLLIAYCAAQVISNYMNGISIRADFVSFGKMSIFLLCISIEMQKYGKTFISFIYRVFELIIYVNGVSIILTGGRGITQDSYGMALYFWSSRNHIVSLVLATLAIGFILKELGVESKRRYTVLFVFSICEVLALKSSTAIIATLIFVLFLIADVLFRNMREPIRFKWVITGGFVLQVLVVVYRIQEKFEAIIAFLFNKNATLTGRTDLWDQALEAIPKSWLFGYGNPSAAGQEGWLSMSYWDSLSQSLYRIYYVAHNQFLEILLNGGLVAFVPFVLAIVFSVWRAAAIPNKRVINIMCGTLFAYFVVMISEVLYPYPPVWVTLLSFAHVKDVFVKEAINCEKTKNYCSDGSL